MLNLNKRYKVYKITFPNNKVYIGFTCNFKSRMLKHASDYKSRPQLLVNRAIKLYGLSNCNINIMFKTDNKLIALQKEIDSILYYNSTNAKKGYNISPGGSSKPHIDVDSLKQKINLVGHKFSYLTVVKRSNKTYSSGSVIWHCRCDCGNSCERAAIDLRSNKNKIKSCGCKTKEAIRQIQIKHNSTKTAEYRAWKYMKAICSNYNLKDYKKGVTIHKAWLGSFEAFIKDIGLKPSPKHKLIRKDMNKNYTPTNTEWALNRSVLCQK